MKELKIRKKPKTQTKSHMDAELAHREGRNGIRSVSKLGQEGIYGSICSSVPQNHKNTLHSHMHHTSLSEITSVFLMSSHCTQRHELGFSTCDSSGLLLFPLWLNSFRFPITCSVQRRDSFSWHCSHVASGFILNTPRRYFHCFF